MWEDNITETGGGDINKETGKEEGNKVDPEDPGVNGGVGGGEGDKETISDGESNTGLIAAGVITPLILLAAIAVIVTLVVLFIWKRRYEQCIFSQI